MNYRLSINLLKLQGAQLSSVNLGGRNVNCVILPIEPNHISVTADQQTRQPNGAYFNLLCDEPGNAYYNKLLQENPKAKMPSHMVYVNPMPDARKRLEVIREQQLRNDPDYMATNPTAEDITRRARYDVKRTMQIGRAYELTTANEYHGQAPAIQANAYQPTGQEQANQQQQAMQQAPQQAYAPQPQSPYERPTSNVNPGDDLPF